MANMRVFKHLTRTDRLRIEKWLAKGMKPRQIADRLRVHISTIYRELKRGEYERLDGSTWETYTAYSPDIAEQRYLENLHAKGAPLKVGNDFAFVEYIENKIISEKCSPAAALGYAQNEGREFQTHVCLTTLYSYIDKGVFLRLTNKDLPEKTKRHRKYNKVKKASRPPAGESIEKRSQEVNTRSAFGHWEMDTVYSCRDVAKQSLLVLTERKTRKEIIMLMPDRTAESTVRALDRLERRYGAMFRKLFRSITVDNGGEFSDVAGLERSVMRKGRRTKIYYCHPYSSFERGSNENANRMIRRQHPKGTNFANVTAKTIRQTENWINNYPRKIHGYRSAEMLWQACIAAL